MFPLGLVVVMHTDPSPVTGAQTAEVGGAKVCDL